MTAGVAGLGPIEIPAPVLGILRRLEESGYETWCVGGAIRDAIAGDPHQDVDLATAARPETVRTLFPRSIDVGMEHGTVGVLDDRGMLHEVTTFRRDVATDGRHATVEFGVSLDDDLARRDFTINAMAYHPLRHEWRDPFHGYDDLTARLIRAVGDPARRFREDRLRILRALRFAARFGFTVEAATWGALVAQAQEIDHLSAERVRDEWVKGVVTAQSIDTLVRLWQDSRVSATWLPECRALDARRPVHWHAAAEDRDVIRITALYCAPVGPVWRRFKGSTAEIRRAEAIDRGPARPPSNAGRDVRRWMAGTRSAADDLGWLARARGDDADDWVAVMGDIRSRHEATSREQLAVSGDDLLALGVPRGPAIGRMLEQLLDRVLDEPGLNTRDQLVALARESRS